MDDLRARFAALDRIPVPDVWSEVERRLAAPRTVVQARRVAPVRPVARGVVEDRRATRLLLAAMLIALLVVAVAIATGGLAQPSTVAPTADASPEVTAAPPSARVASEAWVVVGSLPIFRDGGSRATLLDNGNVLLTGGYDATDDPASTDAAVFDPARNAWLTTGRLIDPRRSGHTAVLLSDGRVLVAGGSAYQTSGGAPYARDSAELYDPVTGTSSITGAMSVARTYQLATVLPDGSVMVVGGYSPDVRPTNSTEIFDPGSGTWAEAGRLTTLRIAREIALIPGGRVVVVGEGSNGGLAAETFDPVTRSWTPEVTLRGDDCADRMIGLPDGRLLIMCGTIYDTDPLGAELVDPASGTRTLLPAPSRRFVSAVLLSDGRVLLSDTGAGEILDPRNGTWTSAGLPTYTGSGPSLFRVTDTFYETDTATLLRDGRVLMTIGPAALIYDPGAAP